MMLVLASQSPRRAQLLAEMGLQFETCIPAIDETRLPGEETLTYVERLAVEKAARGFTLSSKAQAVPKVVVAADTIVVLTQADIEDEILGKPRGLKESEYMLGRLSGQTHHVHTGVAVTDGQRCESAVVSSTVEFRDLSSAEITHYAACGEGADKAGSYGIQGIGGIFVRRIEGSYSGVMGLPVATIEILLQSFNVDTWSMRTQWLKNYS